MADLLEYLIRVRGGAAAAAQMREVAGATRDAAKAQLEVAASAKEAEASTTKMGGALGIASKGVVALGVAAVDIGLDAVRMSSSFNHEMLRIRTDAGASTKELARMKGAVLDLAASGQSMGQGPMALAQGLYHLESLGIRGSRAIQALKLSSEEAAISGASLEETTSALGAAFFVGVKGAGSLEHVMAILNATVGSGNMRFGQLIEGLGTGVLGAFKAAHMSIQDMSAAVAVLTDDGYRASSATAQLATALHFLYAPSTKAEAALSTIGLSGRQLAADLMKPQGLLVALQDLHKHMAGLSTVDQEQMLGAILPGGRGRVLLNLFEQTGRLQGKYGQEASILGSFRGSVAMQRHDPTTQLHMRVAAIQADMIRLGNTLTPLVIPAVNALLGVGAKLIGWLSGLARDLESVIGWFRKHHDATVALTAVVLGLGTAVSIIAARFCVVRLATEAWAAAQWLLNIALDANPIGLLIVGISALVVGLVYAYRHSRTFRDIVQDVGKVGVAAFGWIVGAVKDVITWVGNAITYIERHWPYIETVLTGPFTAVATFASNLFSDLKGIVADALLWIETKINSVIGVWNDTVGSIGGPSIGLINTTGTAIAAGKIDAPGGGYVSASANHASLVAHGTIGPAAGAGRKLTNSVPGHQPRAVGHAAAMVIHAHFEHPIVVDGQVVARVVRREMIKAQAANA